MRPLSWANIGILSCVLCTTCLAGPSHDLGGIDGLQAIERRDDDHKSAPSFLIEEPVAATADDDDDDDEPKKSRTSTAKASNTRKSSAASKTSATAETTSEATSKQQSTKTASPTPSRSESTKKPSATSDSSTSVTSTSTSSSASTSLTSTSRSSSASTSSASVSSSTSPTNVAQPTSILQPQPQSSSRVSTGGIIAGVVLGAAIVSGMAWIAIGKWRDKKRQRDEFADDESKDGFTDAAGGGHDWSSQESLLAGAKPGRGSKALRLQALSPMSRGHSFVSSFRSGRPGPHMSQEVLSRPSPMQDKALPELPAGYSQFSSPLDSHPTLAEMPSPSPPPDTMLAANSRSGRLVPRKPLPQANVSPMDTSRRISSHQRSPPVELPG